MKLNDCSLIEFYQTALLFRIILKYLFYGIAVIKSIGQLCKIKILFYEILFC